MVIGALSSGTLVPEDLMKARSSMNEMVNINHFSSLPRRSVPPMSNLKLSFGAFEIDLARRDLRRAGEIVHVEPQVFDLIAHLIQNRERIVSQDELIKAIWKGRTVSGATLNSRISAARRALGDNGNDQSLIRTTHKHGFRFVGDVSYPRIAPTGSRTSQQIATDGVPKALPAAEPCAPSARPSIAVLPFENKSYDSDPEYVAEGLTVDIITALSQQHSFFVVSRNSTFSYKGSAVDVRKVSSQLGVRYVLQGSVRRAENRVRITTQVIDAENGMCLWGEKYDRELADIFELQDDITAHVIGSVRLQILVAETARTRKQAALSRG